MLPPLLDRTHPSPADKWLWALLGALVIGQVVAMWLLCAEQVAKARNREAAVRAERVALRDMPPPRAQRAGDVNDVMAALR